MSALTAAPLDTHNAFRYHWTIWRTLGLYPHPTKRWLYWYCALIINSLNALLPLHFAIKLFYFDDFLSLMLSLSITASSLLANLKNVFIFRYSRTLLPELRAYLNYLDRRAEADPEERAQLEQVVRQCHRVFRVYWYNFMFGGVAFFIPSFLAHALPFNGWFPFDWKASESVYLLAYGCQSTCVLIAIVQTIANDSYPVVALIVMIAELRVINMRIAKLGRRKELSAKAHNQALVDCVMDHRICMRYFDCMRILISHFMLMQFLITTFVLCITAIIFVTPNVEFFQKFSFGVYLLCVIGQVLPCCWFADMLLAESSYLTTALYSSNWYVQNQSFRKSLTIFMQRSQRPCTILAGNLVPITLETFVSIIKFAFSMFAILRQIG